MSGAPPADGVGAGLRGRTCRGRRRRAASSGQGGGGGGRGAQAEPRAGEPTGDRVPPRAVASGARGGAGLGVWPTGGQKLQGLECLGAGGHLGPGVARAGETGKPGDTGARGCKGRGYSGPGAARTGVLGGRGVARSRELQGLGPGGYWDGGSWKPGPARVWGGGGWGRAALATRGGLMYWAVPGRPGCRSGR